MKLESAFLKIINTRGLLTSLGYTRFQVADMKRNLKHGRVSVELMRQVARDAGYTCVQQEKWKPGS